MILACLAKDPADRPGSAEALGAMLAELDLPDWTKVDAQMWWDEYGEAVRAAAADSTFASRSLRPSLEVRNKLELSKGEPA